MVKLYKSQSLVEVHQPVNQSGTTLKYLQHVYAKREIVLSISVICLSIEKFVCKKEITLH